MKKKLIPLLIILFIFLFAVMAQAATKEYAKSPKQTAGLLYNSKNITWTQTDSGWTCYNNKDSQQFINRWIHVSYRDVGKKTSEWYYFDMKGIMQTGWLYWDNDWFYLNSDGTLFETRGLKEIDGATYYFNSNGTIARNTTQTINKKIYNFDGDGKLTGSINDKTREKGTTSLKNQSQLDYLNTGRLRRGITPLVHDADFDRVAKKAFDQAIANGDSSSLSTVYSIAVKDGLDIIHIAYIFASASENSVQIDFNIGANELLLNMWYTRVGYYKQGARIMVIMAAYEGEEAQLLPPEQVPGRWEKGENGFRYCLIDDTYVTSRWLLNPSDNIWYHFDGAGYMQTGWFEDTDGTWYYLNPESGAMMTNTTIDGCYLGEDGAWQQ